MHFLSDIIYSVLNAFLTLLSEANVVCLNSYNSFIIRAFAATWYKWSHVNALVALHVTSDKCVNITRAIFENPLFTSFDPST